MNIVSSTSKLDQLRDIIAHPDTTEEKRMAACNLLLAESDSIDDMPLIDFHQNLLWSESGRSTHMKIRYDDIITLMNIDRGLVWIQRAKFAVALALWSGVCIAVGRYVL